MPGQVQARLCVSWAPEGCQAQMPVSCPPTELVVPCFREAAWSRMIVPEMWYPATAKPSRNAGHEPRQHKKVPGMF